MLQLTFETMKTSYPEKEKKPGVVATALEKDFIFKIGIMSKGEVAGKNLVRVTAEHAGIADSK